MNPVLDHQLPYPWPHDLTPPSININPQQRSRNHAWSFQTPNKPAHTCTPTAKKATDPTSSKTPLPLLEHLRTVQLTVRPTQCEVQNLRHCLFRKITKAPCKAIQLNPPSKFWPPWPPKTWMKATTRTTPSKTKQNTKTQKSQKHGRNFLI